MTDKKQLSERDICTKYITPAIKSAGWDIKSQIREEVTFTAGRIHVKGNITQRGTKKRADYILYYKPNIPIAVIEAKDNNHALGDGMQQALDYAAVLDLPFVYSSNGDGFMEHDRTQNIGKIELALPLEKFPSPDDLWNRYKQWIGISEDSEKTITQEYYYERNGKKPRYYQRIAINKSIEAIVNGQNRVLLVMATGTGKTFVAFQIIWRLWKAGIKKRILFLADRNILVDQTRNNDFRPFNDVMHKITGRKVDKSFQVYLALYQAITGEEESKKIFKRFSKDFFDLIVVDECHRGSAAEDSQWREILDYFTSATQIGMTATPKETKYVSNIHYFGDPVYMYSLKQGIDDGFLAPYKVIRVYLDKDLSGWRPPAGKLDKYGQEIEDRIYNLKDYDRKLVIEPRTELVAERTSEYLKQTDRFSKTIIFCDDVEHAGRMRQALINENADEVAKNDKYIMRITGDDDEGKKQLDSFIDPEEDYPVIATTSRLMSTGVDAQTTRVIVLDKTINSMTEFKQIIGRGTRVREDFNKMYFTIIDFKNATRLFYDKDFDGDPVQVYEPKEDDPMVPPVDENGDDIDTGEDDGGDVIIDIDGPNISIKNDPPTKAKKYYVNDVPVEIVAERIQYMDKDKGLVSVSLKDYSKQNLLKEFRSLDEFLNKWNKTDQKIAIITELADKGVFLEELKEQVGKDLDPFDLISHVAFDMPPMTRQERANNVKKRNYFGKYGETARKVMDALLQKYEDDGIQSIEEAFSPQKVVDFLRIEPFTQIGTPLQIINDFGGKKQYLNAIRDLESQLYMQESAN
ncbi:DEAD/DEAH box helicase family protein [bacterium]|nr:DEAD/DEAH box helicase family protein [bacterium]MBU1633955.1 DEAD/DEAH box helicase family protein [bacterium]MBU1875193.1 DEAD/DEAH box helicase family protein [bacterium]